MEACLEFVGLLPRRNALISSKGMAVCMVIDYGVDDWRPGFGYQWGDSLPGRVLLRLLARPVPRDDQASAAAARGRAVVRVARRAARRRDRRAGSRLAHRGSPWSAPSGERVSSPVDASAFEDKPFFLLLPNPAAKLTQVAISHAEWRHAGA